MVSVCLCDFDLPAHMSPFPDLYLSIVTPFMVVLGYLQYDILISMDDYSFLNKCLAFSSSKQD